MNSQSKSKGPYDFKHAFREGAHWVEGPWLVTGPDFSMMLHDRTEAAILTKKLNDAHRKRPLLVKAVEYALGDDADFANNVYRVEAENTSGFVAMTVVPSGGRQPYETTYRDPESE